MSPCSTVTPVASSSSGVMASPGSSQSTPRSRGMSSRTPRPTMPSSATWMELRRAPTLVTSVAGAPLYICPSTKTWQSASMWLTLLPWKATPTKSPAHCRPLSMAAMSPAWIMWCSAGFGLSTAGAVARGRPHRMVTPSRTRPAAFVTRSGVRRLSAPRSSSSPQRPHRFVASNSSALTTFSDSMPSVSLPASGRHPRRRPDGRCWPHQERTRLCDAHSVRADLERPTRRRGRSVRCAAHGFAASLRHALERPSPPGSHRPSGFRRRV